MRKLLKAHDQRNVKAAPSSANEHKEALPSYLLDREDQNQAKVLSSALKQRRKDKAGKFAVPLPKVRGIAEDEAFRVVKTGKTRRKGWKRMVTKVCTIHPLNLRNSLLTLGVSRPLSSMNPSLENHPSSNDSSVLPVYATRKRM